MNVYVNNGFTGHWPVGTAAVVVAEDKQQAAQLLEAELTRAGLHQSIDAEAMSEVDTRTAGAMVLRDGNY